MQQHHNAPSLVWYESLESDLDFLIEDAKIGFAVCLERRLQQVNMSKADLAREIGKSPAYVTKLLRGDANLTIKSMVQLATAVDGSLHIHIANNNAAMRWFEVVQGGMDGQGAAEKNAGVLWAKSKKHQGERTDYVVAQA